MEDAFSIMPDWMLPFAGEETVYLFKADSGEVVSLKADNRVKDAVLSSSPLPNRDLSEVGGDEILRFLNEKLGI